MKKKPKNTVYTGLFVIATMACCTISAMDTKKSSEENSIVWTYSDIVLVPLTLLYVKLWKNHDKSPLCIPHCVHSKEKVKKTNNFFEAQKEHIRLQTVLIKARKNQCPYLKKIEQQKEKAFKEEKKYWFFRK